MKKIEITEQEIADARVRLAHSILESDNAGDILTAMNKLTMIYAKKAQSVQKAEKGKSKGKGKSKQWKRWKHTADEFYTVTMCAVYTKQDQINE